MVSSLNTDIKIPYCWGYLASSGINESESVNAKKCIALSVQTAVSPDALVEGRLRRRNG